jgi:fructose-1,6-bisphosphatase/inositol monophosphatase family enzyme
VSDADRAAEELIRHQLARTRPRDAVVGEEFGTTGHGPRRWIVDPIDGTKNFVRGVPVWATLIALVDGDEPVVGLVAAPALARRWWAAKGAGAYAGRSLSAARPLHVSGVSALADASLSYASLGGWSEIDRREDFLDLMDGCWRTRAYGDFWSYMLLAEGRLTSLPNRHFRPMTWLPSCRSSPRLAADSPVSMDGPGVGAATPSPPMGCCTRRCWTSSATDGRGQNNSS